MAERGATVNVVPTLQQKSRTSARLGFSTHIVESGVWKIVVDPPI